MFLTYSFYGICHPQNQDRFVEPGLVHRSFSLSIPLWLSLPRSTSERKRTIQPTFIKTIPNELDEAALIDGCSVYSIFYRIIIPILKPVLVSVIILTAVPVWNDFQYSVYFLHRPQMRVITLAVASFFQQSGSSPNIAAAAALLVVIPIVLL